MVERRSFVSSNKKEEVFSKTIEIIEQDRKQYKYSVDNMQTYAQAIQPHFTMWVNAMHILGIGGEITEENCRDEMFGLKDEGNHSILCLDYFSQLGEFQLHHYANGYKIAKQVYQHLKKPMVVLSFLIANELNSGVVEDLEKALSVLGVKDTTYVDVHKEADSITSEDGHAIKLLKVLEMENASVEDINMGIQLYRDFYNDIFLN
ncbi:hypothetical protein ACTFIV_003923 [Dictyostelium citrinum]